MQQGAPKKEKRKVVGLKGEATKAIKASHTELTKDELNHYGLEVHRFLNLTKVSSALGYSNMKESLSLLDFR